MSKGRGKRVAPLKRVESEPLKGVTRNASLSSEGEEDTAIVIEGETKDEKMERSDVLEGDEDLFWCVLHIMVLCFVLVFSLRFILFFFLPRFLLRFESIAYNLTLTLPPKFLSQRNPP